MGLFKNFVDNFVEAMVPIDKARTIRKSWGKKNYQPGQFGIEIEYRADEGRMEMESDFDYESAREAFRNETDGAPPSLDDWLEENEEPKEPDSDEYEFDESDPLANLWALNMEREPMNKPLPPALKKYSNTKINQLFSNFSERIVRFLIAEIDLAVGRIHNLYEGRGYSGLTHGYRPSWSMLSSTESLKDFLPRFEAQNNISPSRFESQIRNQYGVNDTQLSREQVDYLRELQYGLQEALDEWQVFQVQRAKSITPEQYATEIKTIWEEDMAEWKEEHETWATERDEIEEAEGNYDEDSLFDNWLDQTANRRFSRSGITNRERFESEIEYQRGGLSDEIDEVSSWIQSNGGNDDWRVFEDETGIIEIASPILSTKDMTFLKTLLDYLQSKQFDDGTGLHLHIGMPPMTDSFDLLAMAATIDEDAVLAMAGRSEDTIDRYTKKKDSLFGNLWRTLPPDGIIPDAQMREQLNRNIDRYYGVNTIKAFQKHGTVEMRYLTSQILDRPNGIEKLFRYINYFLMLPKLARGRQQIRYDIPNVGSMIYSRRQGGSVEIKRFGPKNVRPEGVIMSYSNKPVIDYVDYALSQKLHKGWQQNSAFLNRLKIIIDRDEDAFIQRNPDEFERQVLDINKYFATRPDNQRASLPMVPRKVDDLRQPNPAESPEDRKYRLQKKFGKYKEPMGPPRPPQQPNPTGWSHV